MTCLATPAGRVTTLLIAALLVATSAAQSAAQTQRAARPRQPSPSLAQVDDQPGLPRVLLLGDSISMGYTVPVRELLAGKANVHRAMTNCGPTTRGLEGLDEWLGEEKWDVIHFNFGLHDLVYLDERGLRTEPAQGKHQVPLEQYEQNLRQIVARLKETGAKLIWASTTPVPADSPYRIEGEELPYNAVAAKIMQAEGIAIDDLHAFCKPRLAELQLPANVHFTPAGSDALAKEVVRHIEAALGR